MLNRKTVKNLLNDLADNIDNLLIDSFVLDELGRIINRKMMNKEDSIKLQELILIIRELSRKQKKPVYPTRPITLKDYECEIILKTLKKTKGNQRSAAKLLGISSRVMCYKVNFVHKIDLKSLLG